MDVDLPMANSGFTVTRDLFDLGVQVSGRTQVGSEAQNVENLDKPKLTNTDKLRVSASIVNEMEIV